MKTPFTRPLPLQCSSELLNFQAADRRMPSLSLDIDIVEAQVVFLDDAVYSAPSWVKRKSGNMQV